MYKGGNSLKVIKPDSLGSLPVEDAKDPLQVLPSHAKPKLLVETREVLEAEGSSLVGIVLVEDSLDWSTFSLQAVVELANPVLQDHPLEAPFCLQLSRTVDYMLFEVRRGDCSVLAIVAECPAELLDLVCGEACLQPFEPLGKFSFAKSPWLRFGLLVSPLREQALV